MGRLYTAVSQGVAVTAAQDLISLLTTASMRIRVWRFAVGQSSDAGDAQDELLRIRIRRGMTTVGSGGGTATPAPVIRGDTAAVTVARINDTTAATAGTIEECWEETFNVRAGWVWLPTPEERLTLDVSMRLAFNLPAAPADSITMSCSCTFEELC